MISKYFHEFRRISGDSNEIPNILRDLKRFAKISEDLKDLYGF